MTTLNQLINRCSLALYSDRSFLGKYVPPGYEFAQTRDAAKEIIRTGYDMLVDELHDNDEARVKLFKVAEDCMENQKVDLPLFLGFLTATSPTVGSYVAINMDDAIEKWFYEAERNSLFQQFVLELTAVFVY
jgi:hypothetical protein